MLLAYSNVSKRREGGMYLATVAGILVAILIVCGLVIDGGAIFRMYNIWKNTLDAGALAGGIRLDTNPALSADDLRAPITNLVIENVRQLSLPEYATLHAANNLSIEIENTVPRRLKVSGDIPQPMWLLNLIPGFPDYTLIPARATVQLDRVMLALVLDASGSMRRCIDDGPVGTGNYDNGSPGGYDVPYPGDLCQDTDNIRMNVLKSNVNLLIDRLRSEDWISITAFNDHAFLRSPMGRVEDVSPGNLAMDRQVLKQRVNGIYAGVPGPYTNTREGLELGRRSITHSPALAQAGLRKILLLVSDGAPYEQGEDSGFLSWPEYGDPAYTSDSLHPHNGIPWDPALDTNPAVVQNNDVVPSMLGRTAPVICATINDYQGGLVYNENYPAPFYDPDYDPSEQYVKRLQILAILQADLARQAGIQVFAIGIGDPDNNLGANTPPNNCHEYSGPFQAWHGERLLGTCAIDAFLETDPPDRGPFPAPELHDVKQFLLQRIVNDRSAFEMVNATYNNNQSGLNEFPCVQSTASLASAPRGGYVYAGNVVEFQAAFAQFSQRERLIE